MDRETTTLGHAGSLLQVGRLRVGRLRVGRRAGTLVAATFLAIAIGVSPPAARTALAAGPLRIQADATYTLDPDAGRVHVAIEVNVTNLKPDSGSFVYYYRDIGFPLQPGATAMRAADGGGALSMPTQKRDGYGEATVHLRSTLYYRDSTAFTIRYDLVGAKPRSASPIRIGKAFATFGVWAWGDTGRSTVKVRTPAGFGSQIDGGPMDIATATTGQTLSAEPEDPGTFYTIVSAENRAAYGSTRVSLDGGVEIVVKAWPEDKAWDRTVSDTLRKAMPELRELIGLPWPVAHDLDVRERYTPALEGYAGIFFTGDQRIDVSEDLEPVVIVHEASHAWLNQDLFAERWIYEGLAEEYAWRAQESVGGDSGEGPTRPDTKDPGFVNLGAWTFPEVIRDQQTDDREQYGYDASFWVIHQLVSTAGVERMQDAFRAAQDDVTAYLGAGSPEKVAASDGWKRLLDLVEPVDGKGDPAAVEQALEDFVLRDNDSRALADRREARDQYRDLLEDGDGWLPPWYVRKSMGEWRFDLATTAMNEAAAVLALRDDVDEAATALALEPNVALEAAYQETTDGFSGATSIANDELAALTAIADAKAKVEATPDLVASVGLMGETPTLPYDTARSAFERGDLAQAAASAASAAAIIAGAPGVGQQRLAIAIAVVIGVVVLFALLFALLRRRRRRRALALAGASAAADAAAADGIAADVPVADVPVAGTPASDGTAVPGADVANGAPGADLANAAPTDQAGPTIDASGASVDPAPTEAYA